MNQLAHQQSPIADAVQDQAKQLNHEAEAEKVTALALGADGAEKGSWEQAKNVSNLLKVRPELRAQILHYLHRTMGNAFVQMVVDGPAVGSAPKQTPDQRNEMLTSLNDPS